MAGAAGDKSGRARRRAPFLRVLLALVLSSAASFAHAQEVAPAAVQTVQQPAPLARQSAQEGAPSVPQPVSASGDPAAPVPQTLTEAAAGLDTTGTPSKPKEQAELPPESAPRGETRPLPNYDGRDAEQTDAGDVLIWIPRTIFFPVHAVLEWGVRWPLVSMVTTAEEHHLAERVVGVLTWDDGKAGVYPGVVVDIGVRTYGGVQFFWNRLFWNTDIKASAFVGVNDLWNLQAGTDSHIFHDESGRLSLRGSYVRRPDNPYFGIGDLHATECTSGRPCRYRSAVVEARAEIGGYPENLNRTNLELGVSQAEFSRQADIPSVTAEQAAEIPGFEDGYALIDAGLRFVGDTREENVEFTAGTGVRGEGWGFFAFDPTNTDLRFFRWGAEGAGFLDLGHGNTLGLRLYTESVENVSARAPDGTLTAVPFTELVALGGSETMRGFLQRRFIGNRAIESTLQYRYPIFALFDANLFASIGNAWESLSDWDIKRNFLAYGISLKTSDSRNAAFEILLGFGSSRFDSASFNGAEVVRFTFGINNGF